VSYADNDYDSRRIDFFGGTANADFDGDQWGVRGRVGYMHSYQGVDLTPYLGLAYSNLDLDGFTETGTSATLTTNTDQDFDFVQSTLGFSVSKRFETAQGVSYVPEAHVAWLHEFADDNQANTSTFVATGGTAFSTQGLDPADDSANIGASLSIYASDQLDVRAAYDFEINEDYDSHTGQLVIRYRFY